MLQWLSAWQAGLPGWCRSGNLGQCRDPSRGRRSSCRLLPWGDVVESVVLAPAGRRGRGLESPGRVLSLLVEQGDESGPEWGYGAGAADDFLLAVDEDVVAGVGVGVAGDVGYSAAGLALDSAYRGLVGWDREGGAVAAAGGSALVAVIPRQFRW